MCLLDRQGMCVNIQKGSDNVDGEEESVALSVGS